ncbi:MAG TPA: glutathione S-transferase family protein [Sphingomicrobium sp.]|jgi:glutathione S-transferase|nr:glutathione S-transferase family protein [Sphingomicrobium sp.]
MPINPNAEIEITAFRWVPEFAQGLVRDLRVRWALEEAGLDYRVRLLDVASKPADYVKEQPFEQVPCFNDGIVQIFETGAIVQYLGEKSEALLPRDPRGKFKAIQWVLAALNSLEPAVQHRALLDTFYQDQEWAKLRKPSADEFARLKLKRVSDRLGENEWLEGDRFTIGDLMMVTVLRLADRAGLLDDTPNLARYVKRGEARPAFKAALEDQLATYREHQPEGVAA